MRTIKEAMKKPFRAKNEKKPLLKLKAIKKKPAKKKAVGKSAPPATPAAGPDVYDLQAQLADMTKERDSLAERLLVLEAGASGAEQPVTPTPTPESPDEHPQEQQSF